MYTHNLDPILFDFEILIIRWYSLAYIFGIIIGWWLGKKIILNKFLNNHYKVGIKEFDNLITYLIISILIGGRVGYILFYNFNYYLLNPFDIMVSEQLGRKLFHRFITIAKIPIIVEFSRVFSNEVVSRTSDSIAEARQIISH